METLADFGTMQLFAVQTFTTGIYHTWFGTYNAPGAAQLSLSLLIFISFFIFWNATRENSSVSTHKAV